MVLVDFVVWGFEFVYDWYVFVDFYGGLVVVVVRF